MVSKCIEHYDDKGKAEVLELAPSACQLGSERDRVDCKHDLYFKRCAQERIHLLANMRERCHPKI